MNIGKTYARHIGTCLWWAILSDLGLLKIAQLSKFYLVSRGCAIAQQSALSSLRQHSSLTIGTDH